MPVQHIKMKEPIVAKVIVTRDGRGYAWVETFTGDGLEDKLQTRTLIAVAGESVEVRFTDIVTSPGHTRIDGPA
jgi:hypothetical protein